MPIPQCQCPRQTSRHGLLSRLPARGKLAALGVVCLGAVGGPVLGQVTVIAAEGFAGPEPGDRLIRAVLPGGAGEVELDSPLVLELTAHEWSARRGAVLVGESRGEPRRWSPPAAPWGLRTAPELSAALSASYRAAIAEDADPESLAALRDAAESSELAPADRAWLWREIGRLSEAAGDAEAADEALGRSIAALEGAPSAWRAAAEALVRLSRAGLAMTGARWEAAATELEAAAAAAPARGLLAASIASREGTLSRRQGQLDAAEASMREALEIRERLAPDSYVVAHSLVDLSQLQVIRQDVEGTQELAGRALEIQRAAGLEREAARSLGLLGRAALLRDDFAAVERYLSEANEILSREAPDSTDQVAVVVTLGIAARRRGLLDQALERFETALGILQRVEPDGPGVPNMLNNLGVVAWDRGDLATAERRWREAATELERISPGDDNVPRTLMNLATAIKARGDFVEAERIYRRALEMQRSRLPRSKTVATILNNMGGLRKERGDLEGAERLYRQTLEIHRELAPGALDEALVLVNLAQVAQERGELVEARRLLDRSLEIRERLAPDSTSVAISLASLGGLALETGDLETAEERFERALEIRRAQAPGGLAVSVSLRDLGRLARERGELEEAEARHREALEIRRRLVPGSLREAESWHDLGLVQRDGGRREEAERSLCHATELLDELEPSVGEAEEDRVRFRAEFADDYRDCLDAQVAAGRPEAAFATLERSRARSLLLQLSERDLGFDAELPSELADALRRNQVEADRALERLARSDQSVDAEETRAASARLIELREERVRLRAQVRTASPRLAALRDPEPLDASEAARVLDDGTVLLAYSCGESRTLLFVIGGPRTGDGSPVEVHEVALSRAELEEKVRGLRTAIARRQSPDPELDALGAELYRTLVAPAEAALSEARRVLISPDGPLHVLPFAALRSPLGAGEEGYLIERWPIHSVLSATVYRELRAREAGRARSLVAFGDPFAADGAAAVANDGLRAYLGPISDLEPLPWARREVRAIAALLPRDAQVFVGRDASESRVKALAGNARYLHFATHGLLSERFPMSSALRLASPERGDAEDPRVVESAGENGLLEAWEVIEQLRLDARLVTLSSCDSALGRDLGGEGLVGLTRAFQYAGARAVLASIWQVADRATAELMEETYRQIAEEGASLDEALRAAQLELIARRAPPAEADADEGTRGVGAVVPAGSPWRHPFFWAGFQLYGDPG